MLPRNSTTPSVLPALPEKSGSSRLTNLDAARSLATFAVIWVHVVEYQSVGRTWAALGRFGTSFYICCAVYFAILEGQRARRTSWEDFLYRARRLLVPFAIFSGVYAARSISWHLSTGVPMAGMTTWWGPLAGTALHLWFLPFAFVVAWVARSLTPHLMRLPGRLHVGLAVCGTALVYWYFHGQLFYQLDRGWSTSWHLHRLDRWIEEVPLAVTMLLFGTVFEKARRHRSLRRWVGSSSPRVSGLLALAFVSVTAAYAYFSPALSSATGSDTRSLVHIAGVLLFFCMVLAPAGWGPLARLSRFAAFTYGAFLVHLFVLQELKGHFSQYEGHGGVPVALLSSMTVFLVSVGLSAAYKMRKHVFAWSAALPARVLAFFRPLSTREKLPSLVEIAEHMAEEVAEQGERARQTS